MNWVGGLAIDGRSLKQVTDAVTEIFKAEGYECLPENDVDVAGDERLLVIAGSKGWTALYLENSDKDEDMAVALSKDMSTTVLVHRSIPFDAFALMLYHSGDLLDEYQSHPFLFHDFTGSATEPDLENTVGNPETFKTLVSRVDAGALSEIYQSCRMTDLDAPLEDPDLIKSALRQLRKATGVGTFEHSMDDLWYRAEDLKLKVRYLAFLAPPKPKVTPWQRLTNRAREARDRWLAPARNVRDRVSEMAGKVGERTDKLRENFRELVKKDTQNDDTDSDNAESEVNPSEPRPDDSKGSESP